MSGREHPSRRKIRDFVHEAYEPGEGAASAEKVLERLLEAYKTSTRESNKLFALSSVISLFYLIKTFGLRIDVLFVDKKIFEIPYGVAFFCLSAQVVYSVAWFRYAESRIFDRYMNAVTEKVWPRSGEFLHYTLIGADGWLQSLLLLLEKGAYSKSYSSVMYATAVVASLAMLVGIMAPLWAGIFFMLDFERQSGGNHAALQWWIVLVSTAFAFASTFVGWGLYAQDNDEL